MHADFRMLWAGLLVCGSTISLVSAFYVPGYSIKSYEDDDAIPLFVNKVYSDNTQLQFPYFDLPFVCPAQGRKHAGLISGKSQSLNLGEVIRGDRIMSSDYDLAMGKDMECHFLCSHSVDRSAIQRAQDLIDDGYVAEWIVDNLPGATSFVTVDKSRKYYAAGFKLGYKGFSPSTGRPTYFINNHVTLVFRWRRAPGRNGGKVIVGFEIYTKSIGLDERTEEGCPRDVHDAASGLELIVHPNSTDTTIHYPGSSYAPELDDMIKGNSTMTIPFSYSVYWRSDDRVEWANRWDMYFKNQDDSNKIHWFAIVNSLVIAGLLTAVVVMVWNRTLRADTRSRSDLPLIEESKALRSIIRKKPRSPRGTEKGTGLLDQPGESLDDIAGYSSDEELLEDVTGWKLLHADVFRTPAYAGLLAPLLGSGTQLVFMASGLLVLSAVGVLNPSYRGGFVSVGIGLFVFAGLFSGYFSGRVYKTFNGINWRKNTLMTALLFPGFLFVATFTLNLFVWAQASSTALPFSTLLGLAALWLLIQVPLVYMGSWYGFYRSPAWEHPTKTSSIPRQIPSAAWHGGGSMYAVLLAGLVPFAVIFVELLFVFRSLWLDKSGYYYMFGFLSVVSVVLIVTIVEVTIVAVYVQFCHENYHWWWHSFFVGAASSVWIFAYCCWYYFTKLHMTGFIPAVLFFSYSFLACAVYGLLAGIIGFVSAYAFVRRIYGAIKAD